MIFNGEDENKLSHKLTLSNSGQRYEQTKVLWSFKVFVFVSDHSI